MNNLLSVDNLDKAILNRIFKIAREAKTQGHLYNNQMEGKVLATLFFEPSTRTRLSFQTAMLKMGGGVIDFGENTSLKRGESHVDTIKTVSQIADIIAIRHPLDIPVCIHGQNERIVPIINAGEGAKEHPTQALIDYFTICENRPHDKELTIMFAGDLYYSRTVNSLIRLLKLSDYKLELIFTNEVNPELKADAAKVPGCCYYGNEQVLLNELPGVDVLYVTRMQKERHNLQNPRSKRVDTEFKLSGSLANRMQEDAIILHPLPRNDEICATVDINKRAKYFEQVQNGVYVRMALIYYMLRGYHWFRSGITV